MTAVLTASVWKELCYHYSTDNSIVPSKDWTEHQIYQLLQQYPAGISRAILLTELEYKWRVVLKRGEHSGKLKQAMSIMQLALSDIIVGKLSKLDEFRCVVASDGAECNMIMHRQLTDWSLFMESNGVDIINGKTCGFIQCRLLKMKPPLLLPTPLACFELHSDANTHPEESYILTDILAPMHDAFHATHCCNNGGGGIVAAGKSALGQRPQEHLPFPDNNETHTLIAEVLGISLVRAHGSALAAAALAAGASLSTVNCTSTSTFRVVTLLVRPNATSGISGDGTSNSSGGEDRDSVNNRIVHLILFDDQIPLSDFLAPHDTVVIYRPFVRSNDEERLYGHRAPSAVHDPRHSLVYEVVTRPDPSLSHFLPPSAEEHPEMLLPFHLLYGSVTVLSKIVRSPPIAGVTVSTNGNNSSSGSNMRVPTASSIISPVSDNPQDTNNTASNSQNDRSPSSTPVTARVIDIYILPVSTDINSPHSHQQQHQQHQQHQQLAYTSSYVTELWLEPLPLAQSAAATGTDINDTATAAPHCSQLIRVRYLCHSLPTQSVHLKDRVATWQQGQHAIQHQQHQQQQQQANTVAQRPPQKTLLYPLKCTQFEHDNKLYSIGHLLHFTNIVTLSRCDVASVWLPPMPQQTKPRQQMHLRRGLNGTGESNSSNGHGHRSVGHNEPGPVPILHYISNRRGLRLSAPTHLQLGSQSVEVNMECVVLNCVLSSGAVAVKSSGFLFPSSASNFIVMPAEQQAQLQYSLTQANNAAQMALLQPMSADQTGGNGSDGGSGGSGGCAVFTLSRLTALTGSPSLYLPATLTEAWSGKAFLSVTIGCCVYIVGCIQPLHEGVRHYTQPPTQQHQSQLLQATKRASEQLCYQLVRLTVDGSAGAELICVLDGTVTTSHITDTTGDDTFSQMAKRPRNGTQTSPVPYATKTATITTFKSSAVNITSSVYFDPVNGGIQLNHNSSSNTVSSSSSGFGGSPLAVGVKYQSNNNKQYALLLSRIDDITTPVVFSSGGSSVGGVENRGVQGSVEGKPLVAQYRIEVINDVNQAGLEFARSR